MLPHMLSLAPKKLSQIIALALVLFALNIFMITPVLIERFGAVPGYGVFIGILVGVTAWLGFALGYSLQKTRFEIMRIVSVVIFVEHVGFKGVWTYLQVLAHPTAWQNATTGTILFSLFFSFIPALPIVLLIALLGNEVALLLARKPGAAENSSSASKE